MAGDETEFLRMDAVHVTKTACLIVAILALIIGVLYILARTSRLAYLDVRKAAQAGATDAVLTDYEVKNIFFSYSFPFIVLYC